MASPPDLTHHIRAPDPRSPRSLDAWWRVLKDALAEWIDDKAPMHGAALAFYSMLSLAPLLLIAIAIAGAVFGEQAARGEVMTQVKDMIGEEGGRAVEATLASARQPETGLVATVIGVGTLLFGAAGVFGQLKDSLNTIWNVKPRPASGVLGFLRSQVLSFGMVLGIAFLLMVSLIVSSILSGLEGYARDWLGGYAPLAQALNQLVSLGVYVLLFALIYRVLPEVEITWKDVWTGAIITSVLFLVGKYLIGLYLGKASVGSAYGAAGSLVVVLVWVYYSAQILFFGAEVTQVYTNRYGSRIVADRDAVPNRGGSVHPDPRDRRADHDSARGNAPESTGSPMISRPDFHRPRNPLN
jgi:membrane protein